MSSRYFVSMRTTLLAAVIVPASLIAAGLLGGCGMGAPAMATDTVAANVSGNVHGGNSPVGSSTINLYATVSSATISTSGYAAAGGAGQDLLGTTTSDANGNFTIGSVTCPAGQYAYIQALGGNPGLGTTPTSSPINLVAAIGPCRRSALDVPIAVTPAVSRTFRAVSAAAASSRPRAATRR